MLSNHRIDLFVDNYVGVLDRILILVRRSGWNVKDLHVTEESGNDGTRIQFIIEGKADLSLLRTQLSRLDCIQSQSIDRTPGIHRELALVAAPCGSLQELARELGARYVLTAGEEDFFEFTGTHQQVSTFLLAAVAAGRVRTLRSGALDL